jgi:NAD(P)H dehydrogenase (quinone)
MRHLLVFGHPQRRSYTGWALEELAARLRERRGQRVTIRDLSEEPLEPHLTAAEYAGTRSGRYASEVRREFERLRDHETLTLIFPLWWMGFPARLKGWLDRVLAYGLAYELDGETPIPKLSPRRAATLATLGTPLAEYDRDGSRAALEHAWGEHVFRFCGLEPAGHAWLDDAVRADDALREEHTRRIAALADQLTRGGTAAGSDTTG